MIAAGIRSLAITLPNQVRTNDYWCQKYPEIAQAQQKWLKRKAKLQDYKTKTFELSATTDHRLFDLEMAPYMDDPFCGAVERRLLEPGETTTSLAVKAARQALEAADITPTEIDLLISNTVFPDNLATGDATYIARELGYKGGAFSINATCAGSMTALLTACAFVRSGQAHNVLVVTACNYSRAMINVNELDVTSRLAGDAAGAFVIGQVESDYGILGAKSLNTSDTCGAWLFEIVPDVTGKVLGGGHLWLRMTEKALQATRVTIGPYMRQCTTGALEAAQVSLEDIKFFVFNTSAPWHAAFSTKILGIDPEQTLDTFPWYGNIGSATMPVNLHHGACLGKIQKGDLVLLYMYGGEAQAVAAVVRWGDVKLGAMPLGIPNTATGFDKRQMDSELMRSSTSNPSLN